MKYSTTRILFFASAIVLLLVHRGYAQKENLSWSVKWENPRVFIENKGQFSLPGEKAKEFPEVLYAIDDGSTMIYFTSKGVVYSFLSRQKEKVILDKANISSEEELKKEKAKYKLQLKKDVIGMKWENASDKVKVVASEEVEAYHNYTVKKGGSENNFSSARSFKKLTYKDIYPGIDLEFVFHPEKGIKYSFILSPGASPRLIRMVYSGDTALMLNSEGNLQIPTLFGDITDHAPVTFYGKNMSAVIPSRFKVNGNTVSFELGSYDNTQKVVIDPWTITPAFSNSNKIWECDKDGSGNVYLYGGDTPMRLRKYNSAGVLQWTYNTAWDTASYWVGTLITDQSGNSYITSGSNGEIRKINTTGTSVWFNNPNGMFGPIFEYWNLTFNCDQTQLVVGGMRAQSPLSTNSYRGAVMNINLTNGAVLSNTPVGWMAGLTIKEVRSICSSPNGSYYFLTLDSVGCLTPALALSYKATSGYNFSYGIPNYGVTNQGISAIRATSNFIYTQNGTTLHKRNISNGAIVATAAIPGGLSSTVFGTSSPGNSGLDIDDCGNIYIGSGNQVVKYDSNLNLISSVATTSAVYDVVVVPGGEVVACGNGFASSINMSACAPVQLVCSITTPLSTTTSATNILCNAQCTGSATVTASGGTGPYTYSWAPSGGTSATATGLCAGSFTCTITDNVGATTTATVSITQPSALTATSSSTNLSCNSQCNGTASVTASGGTGPYSYSWAPSGGSSATASGLCAGNYTCTITDANGCTQTRTFTITQPSALTATSASTGLTCNNQCNGTASVTASGGTGAYTYSWGPSGGTNATATALCAGGYTCTITDANGCTQTRTFTITQPPAITASATSTPATCSSSNGSATVTASGGTGTLTYSWAPSGGTNATATGLAAGTYTVSVTDANGCAQTATTAVTTSNGPAVTVQSQTNVSCNGGSTGSVTISVSGGTAPYTYSWSPSGGTNASATGLSAGTYTCTITDNAGCIQTQTISITEPVAITASATSTPASCNSSDGSATVSASGGTGSFAYSWAPSGGTSATASSLSAGSYTCTVTDGNSCPQTATVSVSSSNGPTITVQSQTNVTCNGGSTGSATLSAAGGTPPYTYSWLPSGGTNATATGLSAGTYTCTITDDANCVQTQTVNITEPTAIIANAAAAPASCNMNNGSATVTASGGTGTLTYSWAPSGGTGATETGLAAGSYTCTVTDANGCTQDAAVNVSSSNGPAVTVQSQANVLCNGGSTGSVTVSVTGGTAPYTYSWSPSGGTNATATGLSAGSYTCTITDANACVQTQSVNITEPAAIAASTTSTPTSCNNANGSATVTASGGTGAYTYSWAPTGGTGPTATGMGAGSYTCTITDANGCMQIASATVSSSNGPAATLQSQTNVACNGGSTGSATVNVTGGTPPYTYSWLPAGGNAATASGLSSGTYGCTITDAAGCVQTQTVSITEPAALAASAASAPACGDSSGIASVTATGGTSPFTYSWLPSGGTSATATGLPSGSYTSTVTDANGCTQSATVTVISTPYSAAAVDNDLTIFLGTSTTLTASGGGTYLWSTGSTSSSITVSPTSTTTYCVEVSNGGCNDSACVTVTVDLSCGELFIPNAFSPNNDNQNDELKVLGRCITEMYFAIYDRWGEKVFETTSQNVGWDGTFRGEVMNSAVFVYYLDATLVTGEQVIKKGNISLVR